MFKINADKSIHITRGDIASIEITAKLPSAENYIFQPGDVVQFKVFEKKRCDNVFLVKPVRVMEETEVVTINLDKTDTKLGESIDKPFDYWYEVELNPDTVPQTIIGYDDDGAKIFRLYPEGGDLQ